MPAALLAGAAAIAVRFARSSGEERLQLKWIVAVGLLVVVAAIPFAFVPQLALSPAAESAAVSTVKVVFSLALVCLFAAIAVAVLKYRLYDIDRVISRTVAYAIVTGVLAGVYAGLVLLATGVFGVHAPVAVAAATLAAAALFSPVRRRVQRRVDRRFNRARYDADRAVAAFAAQLKDAVDLDTVLRRTWPALCTRHWSPPTSQCGPVDANEISHVTRAPNRRHTADRLERQRRPYRVYAAIDRRRRVVIGPK